MPMEPDKRRLRREKRAIKRAGSKHRRQKLKRDLRENPDEAAHSEESVGRYRSADHNALDRDPTRRRGE